MKQRIAQKLTPPKKLEHFPEHDSELTNTQVEKWKQGETSRPPRREMIFLRRGSRLWNS